MSVIKQIVRGMMPANMRDWLTFLRQAEFRIEELQWNQQRLARLYQLQHYGMEIQSTLPEINQHEFSVSSQNGEDGILLYIFSKIGTSDRRFVEFGIGDGHECNTANLSLNFGWQGLLMEANKTSAELARHWYAQKLGSVDV